MKIGVLTFFCAHNYGAVLQCYALLHTLKSLGYEAEVINYKPKYLEDQYRIFNIHRFISRNPIKIVKNILREILMLKVRISRYQRFDDFITRYLCISEQKGVVGKYDVYIMGSDQIWNPGFSGGFDPVYFGCFTFEKGVRKYISYAASMGATDLSDEEKDFYRINLQKFDAISVRENHLQSLLQPLSKQVIYSVLDPTFLLSEVVWDSILVRPRCKGKKYVLVYQVREDAYTIEAAESIASQIGAEVMTVCAAPSRHWDASLIKDASPCEFLGLIKYAMCIVTTSFHGTAFSIIYNKPFYCIRLNDNGDSRVDSLLKDLSLQDRMVDRGERINFQPIDYGKCNVAIAQKKEESVNFLKKSIMA